VLCCVEHLQGDVFQQFFLGRQLTPLQITRVVDHHLWVAHLRANRGECLGDGSGRHQVQLDSHALAALLVDRLFQRSGIGAVPSRKHYEEAFLGKLLGDGTPDAPADADGQVTIIEHLPMR
jgi:hypothetical protein